MIVLRAARISVLAIALVVAILAVLSFAVYGLHTPLATIHLSIGSVGQTYHDMAIRVVTTYHDMWSHLAASLGGA